MAPNNRSSILQESTAATSRSVRFSEETVAGAPPSGVRSTAARNIEHTSTPNSTHSRITHMNFQRRLKRPRPDHINEDEMDDADDWQHGDDTGNLSVSGDGETGNGKDPFAPSRADLLQLKRKRRMKQKVGGNDEYNEDEDSNDEAAFKSYDDRDTTGTYKHTSLKEDGIEIEPFNMQQESSDGTGYFDGDTYVFRRQRGDNDDGGGEPDAWLDSLKDNKPIKTSPLGSDDDGNEEARDIDLGKTSNRNLAPSPTTDAMDRLSVPELCGRLLPLLSDAETVTNAIMRYGDLIKKERCAAKAKLCKGPAGTAANGSDIYARAKASLDEITGIANALLLKGKLDIYQTSRKSLVAIVLPETKTDAPDIQESPAMPVLWEYQGSQDGKIHGPYSTRDMFGWVQAGYFVGATAVNVRSVREVASVDESTQDDLLTDLMDDEDDDEGAEKSLRKATTIRSKWMVSDEVNFGDYM